MTHKSLYKSIDHYITFMKNRNGNMIGYVIQN